MPLHSYLQELDKVKGLRGLTRKYMHFNDDEPSVLASAMEFALDGLHQFSKIAKDEVDHTVAYKDMIGSIFKGRGAEEEEH